MACSEKELARKAAYRAANLEKVRASTKACRDKNKERYRAKDAEYKARPEVVARRNQLRREKYANDPQFRLSLRLRNRLNQAIKLGGRLSSLEESLGCSLPQLKSYLESQFSDGMSWATHGQWHIDHRKPLASFDLKDPDQFAQACHYTNLQPLWKIDNLKKGHRG